MFDALKGMGRPRRADEGPSADPGTAWSGPEAELAEMTVQAEGGGGRGQGRGRGRANADPFGQGRSGDALSHSIDDAEGADQSMAEDR